MPVSFLFRSNNQNIPYRFKGFRRPLSSIVGAPDFQQIIGVAQLHDDLDLCDALRV
jgi:hypothetical protein